MHIRDIHVGDRHRQDLGNMEGLKDSIMRLGLLHPIVVASNGALIAGYRRLEACKRLGWMEVPVTIVDLDDPLTAERDENTCRKDFTPSEAVAIGRAIEERERPGAEARMLAGRPCAKLAQGEDRKTRDVAAKAVGMSHGSYEKAKAVVEAAEREPEKYAPVLERMDDSGNVHGAYKALIAAQKEQAKQQKPTVLPNDRCRLIVGALADVGDQVEAESIGLIFTDPPYPREFLSVYGDLARFAARVLKPGGSLLVMVGQSYLPEILTQFNGLLRYNWALSYLTPGGQAVQLWQRKVNTFWKPILWFTKGPYTGDWIGDVSKSATNDNDKRFHDWGQSESGIADVLSKFAYPDWLVCDPFVGGGAVAVVALGLGCQFLGIDIDPQAICTTRQRVTEMLSCPK